MDWNNKLKGKKKEKVNVPSYSRQHLNHSFQWKRKEEKKKEGLVSKETDISMISILKIQKCNKQSSKKKKKKRKKKERLEIEAIREEVAKGSIYWIPCNNHGIPINF